MPGARLWDPSGSAADRGDVPARGASARGVDDSHIRVSAVEPLNQPKEVPELLDHLFRLEAFRGRVTVCGTDPTQVSFGERDLVVIDGLKFHASVFEDSQDAPAFTAGWFLVNYQLVVHSRP